MSIFGGGGAVERIGVELVAKTGKFFQQVDGAVGKAEGKFGGMAKKVGKAVALGAAAGGVALAGLGAAALKMGMDFEASIAEVKTLLPSLSEEGFDKLKGDVLDLSKEMGIATSEMVPALYQAISAGVPPENVIDFLRTGAKASIGGVTDLATAVDGLSTVVNAFGYDAKETGRVADVMFTAVKLGKTTMAELSQSMFQAAPLAAALGLDIEDVAAATATLTKSGTPTSVAMTQIRQAMTAMAKPTADMTDLLAKTGYESGEALLKAEGFAGALGVLSEAADGNKEVLGKAFGSVEALQAVLGLTGENAEVAAADLEAMSNAAGASDEAFKTMTETAKFKLNKAINSIKVEMTKFGVKVLPLVATGLEWVVGAVGDLAAFISEELVPVLKEWWKEHGPGIVGTLEDIWDVLDSTLLPALKTLGEFLIDDVFPAIKKVFNFLRDNKEIVAAFGIAIMAVLVPGIIAWTVATVANVAAHIALAAAQLAAYAPIIAIIAVIALLVYGIIMLVKHWDEVVAFITDTVIPMFEDLWTKIDEFLSNLPIIGEVWEAVKNVVKDKIDAVIGIVQGLIDFAKELITFFSAVFSGDWSAAWSSLKELAKIALNLFLDFLQLTFYGTIKSVLESIVPWDWVKEKFNDFKTKASEVVGAVVGFFEGLPGKITGFLSEVGTAAYDFGGEIVKQLGKGMGAFMGWMKGPVNAIITAFEKGINFLLGGVEGLGSIINGVLSGINAVIGFFGGPSLPTIPPLGRVSIPRVLQHGGPLAAGEWARVNEGASIEFFRPFSAGTVLPTAPVGAGAGGSKWTNYGKVINVYGPGRQSRDVLRDLDRQVVS